MQLFTLVKHINHETSHTTDNLTPSFQLVPTVARTQHKLSRANSLVRVTISCNMGKWTSTLLYLDTPEAVTSWLLFARREMQTRYAG